tara:strand:+ start:1647 stop:1859 length:213 start_codon:yes stop_codon:yes gene_type:complete
VKKLIIALVLLLAVARLGNWIKGDNTRYEKAEAKDTICCICDDVVAGIGDLCGSCISSVQKIGKKWGYDK